MHRVSNASKLLSLFRKIAINGDRDFPGKGCCRRQLRIRSIIGQRLIRGTRRLPCLFCTRGKIALIQFFFAEGRFERRLGMSGRFKVVATVTARRADRYAGGTGWARFLEYAR